MPFKLSIRKTQCAARISRNVNADFFPQGVLSPLERHVSGAVPIQGLAQRSRTCCPQSIEAVNGVSCAFGSARFTAYSLSAPCIHIHIPEQYHASDKPHSVQSLRHDSTLYLVFGVLASWMRPCSPRVACMRRCLESRQMQCWLCL